MISIDVSILLLRKVIIGNFGGFRLCVGCSTCEDGDVESTSSLQASMGKACQTPCLEMGKKIIEYPLIYGKDCFVRMEKERMKFGG